MFMKILIVVGAAAALGTWLRWSARPVTEAFRIGRASRPYDNDRLARVIVGALVEATRPAPAVGDPGGPTT